VSFRKQQLTDSINNQQINKFYLLEILGGSIQVQIVHKPRKY